MNKRNPPVPVSHAMTSERPTADHWDVDGLDDADLVFAEEQTTGFRHIDDLGPQEPSLRNRSELHESRSRSNIARVRTPTASGSGMTTENPSQVEEEPARLANGNWACKHLCKDKTKCKHRCCKEGLDHRPKPSKPSAAGSKGAKRDSQQNSDLRAWTGGVSAAASKKPTSAGHVWAPEHIDLSQQPERRPADLPLRGKPIRVGEKPENVSRQTERSAVLPCYFDHTAEAAKPPDKRTEEAEDWECGFGDDDWPSGNDPLMTTANEDGLFDNAEAVPDSSEAPMGDEPSAYAFSSDRTLQSEHAIVHATDEMDETNDHGWFENDFSMDHEEPRHYAGDLAERAPNSDGLFAEVTGEQHTKTENSQLPLTHGLSPIYDDGTHDPKSSLFVSSSSSRPEISGNRIGPPKRQFSHVMDSDSAARASLAVGKRPRTESDEQGQGPSIRHRGDSDEAMLMHVENHEPQNQSGSGVGADDELLAWVYQQFGDSVQVV